MELYGKDRVWPFAQGGGATIGGATLFFLAAVTIYVLLPAFWSGALLVLVAFLWLAILYFFRDPNRTTDAAAGTVIGPGDGRVVAIVDEEESDYLFAPCKRISIFLSVTDVHVQRTPIGGRVAAVTQRPGKYLQAFRPEASTVNEHIAMQLDTPYGQVLVKQIAGILARRCVNYASPGDRLATGQRFGLIRFGSRVDLFLPPDADIVAAVGDRVIAGVTPLAHLALRAASPQRPAGARVGATD
jgi:phosphatidylserine decarboxylase